MIKKDNNSISSVYDETTVIGKIYKGIVKLYESFRKLISSGIPPLTLLNCKQAGLVDYNVYGNSIQEILPSEYQQVEYIEATGTQYIIIDYIATGITSSKGKYQITDTSKARFLFGSRGASGSNFYGLNWGGGAPYKYYNSYKEGLVTDIEIDDRLHTFYKNKGALYIDDTYIQARTDSDFATPYKMNVFACNNDGTEGYLPALAKIFYLQFYDNETLVVDLIPCYRKSDNEIGMYDLVNNIFYTNVGTGTFLKGNNAPTPDTPIEIESVGDKTANLFDTRVIEQGTIADATGKTTDSSTRVRTKTIVLEANIYTLRVDYVSNAPFIRGVHIYNYETEDWEEYKAFNSRTIIFTLSKLSKVRFVFNTSANTVITPEDIIKLNPILQVGESIVGEYEPYGYRIPIKAVNGNIIKDRMKQILTSGGTGGVIEEGTDWAICEMSDNDQATNVEPGSTNYSSGWVRLGINHCKADKWYKVSYDIEYLEVVSGEFNFPVTHRLSQGGITSALNTPIESLGKTYHIEKVWQSNGQPAILTLNSCKVKISNFRFYESENEITTNTTNIYLNEPLRKIGDYADYIDFEGCKVIRNICAVVLGGINERWSKYGENQTYYGYYMELKTKFVVNQLICLCDKLNGLKGYAKIWYGTDLGCYAGKMSASATKTSFAVTSTKATLEEFKVELEENPLNVLYVTETPVEETVELSNVPLNKGTNIIEVDTTIQPSNMEVTYLGKK